MAGVALIAATLIGVETTLYAVAVALYTILLERGRLPVWDRALVELLGRPRATYFGEIRGRLS